MNRSIFIMMVCLSGCALFKKTSKSTATTTQHSAKQLDATELVLKSRGKETKTFTYWNDSGVYQIQLIKEQMDQAKTTQLKIKQDDVLKNKSAVKKTEPVKAWLFIALVVFVGIIVILYYENN